MIKREELAEFVGQVIDIFEDFLEDRNIVLENDEKEGEETEANIYGSDYGELQTSIEDTLYNWNLVEKPNEEVIYHVDEKGNKIIKK